MISLEGTYDLHIHPGPSIQRRRFTALEAVKLANEERMAGVLFLDHTYNTTTMADTINEMGFQTKAFGSMMLNEDEKRTWRRDFPLCGCKSRLRSHYRRKGDRRNHGI